MAKAEKLYTGEFLVLRFTEKAVKLKVPGEKEGEWVPLSQITDPDEEVLRECEGTDCAITMLEWIAKEKGFA